MSEDKKQMISKMILANINTGSSVDQAIDKVFGEGAYKAIAGMIYDELRAKATK